jgi:hypothetical protein
MSGIAATGALSLLFLPNTTNALREAKEEMKKKDGRENEKEKELADVQEEKKDESGKEDADVREDASASAEVVHVVSVEPDVLAPSQQSEPVTPPAPQSFLRKLFLTLNVLCDSRFPKMLPPILLVSAVKSYETAM